MSLAPNGRIGLSCSPWGRWEITHETGRTVHLLAQIVRPRRSLRLSTHLHNQRCQEDAASSLHAIPSASLTLPLLRRRHAGSWRIRVSGSLSRLVQPLIDSDEDGMANSGYRSRREISTLPGTIQDCSAITSTLVLCESHRLARRMVRFVARATVDSQHET